MIHKKFRKVFALLGTVLLFGMTACKAEPVKNYPSEQSDDKAAEEQKKEATGKPQDASGTDTQGVQKGENETDSQTEAMVSQSEISTLIDGIKKNQVTEDAKRTATVKLSDSGIQITGIGCEADGNRLKIKEAGTYEISGSLSDGSIYVNVDNESEVHLILNGVTIHNETSAALYCKKASKVTLTLAEGSVNTLSDGANYVFEEGEDEPDATLYAKHDLVINGSGKLMVSSSYGDALKGKDCLYILGGEILVNSADDGIVGRDLLYVADGTVTVTSVADALKASNDTDASLGNVVIDGGTFVLRAENDGIQAERTLTVNGGNFVITSGGGSANAPVKNEAFGFGGGMGRNPWGDWNATDSAEEDSVSAKGLKAGVLVTVNGGMFAFDTSDDAVHGNTDVVIRGGEFTISSGDDGVHADETLRVEGDSRLLITKSYEGLEALEIIIDGGEIEITASDDGFNAAGGVDGSGFGRPGAGMFGEGEGEVVINGGTITVNAEGDGLDSNGNLTINGGAVVVFGPTSGGNGVLDYGGGFALNGGTLFAAGTSDMAQTPADSSGQYSVAAVLTSRAQAGSTVEIVIDGRTVLSEAVPKQFNYIVASSEEFAVAVGVSVKVNGEECYTGTLTDVVTCFGFSGGTGGFGGMGGFGGNGNLGGFGGNKGNRGDRGNFGGSVRPEVPNGETPQLPNGEMPQLPNGEMPQLPNGETPQLPNGEMPQLPNGEQNPPDGGVLQNSTDKMPWERDA